MKPLASPDFEMDLDLESWWKKPSSETLLLRLKVEEELKSRYLPAERNWGDDALTLQTVRRISRIFQECLYLKHCNFIPEDKLKMILCAADGVNEESLYRAIARIDEDYKLDLDPEEVWEKTVGELVQVVVNHRLKNDPPPSSPEEQARERKKILSYSAILLASGNLAAAIVGVGLFYSLLHSLDETNWKGNYLFTMFIGFPTLTFAIGLLMPSTAALCRAKDVVHISVRLFIIITLVSAIVLSGGTLIYVLWCGRYLF